MDGDCHLSALVFSKHCLKSRPQFCLQIEKGYLIKVGSVKCYSKARAKPQSLKFKCIEEGFIVNVNPETLEVQGQPPKEVS